MVKQSLNRDGRRKPGLLSAECQTEARDRCSRTPRAHIRFRLLRIQDTVETPEIEAVSATMNSPKSLQKAHENAVLLRFVFAALEPSLAALRSSQSQIAEWRLSIGNSEESCGSKHENVSSSTRRGAREAYLLARKNQSELPQRFHS